MPMDSEKKGHSHMKSDSPKPHGQSESKKACRAKDGETYSLNLRIAAIFIVFTTSTIGEQAQWTTEYVVLLKINSNGG